jgi:thermopsin
MFGRSIRPGLAIAVAVVVLLGSLGLASSAAPVAKASLVLPAPAAPAGTPTHAASPPTPSAAAGLAKALAIENALRAKGVSPSTVHLPNFPGAVSKRDQPVAPSYTQAPAPMGVADLGLENESGVLVPYELNTTSVAGTVNITNLESLYLDGDGPDSYGVQLNSVVNGVTIFGNSSFEFWSQNYVTYTVSTDQLVFGDEVWNFSNSATLFPASSIYGFSPNGTSELLPYLYQGYGPAITIGYPFTLTLYLNTSIIADRPALYFNYTVSNDSFRQSSSFDYLIFNSTVGTPTSAAPVPYYQADGYNYDPIGLINDMEIDLLGNDDGDTTAFLEADATISLQYWNATAGALEEVPSAFNAGQETGETAVGLSVVSSGGASPVADVASGPGFVGGLWNYSGNSGAVSVTLHLTPANAFLFVNLGGADNASGAQWVPTAASGVTDFALPTGATYYLDFLMSDYASTSRTESITARSTTPVVLHVTLTADTALGIYTPLFALANSELAAISSGGAGTAASPYVLLNDQPGSLAPEFAQWDDYLFPVFPGLLLAGTSDWVQVTPPSFEIDLPSWNFAPPYVAALGLPLTNDLQLEFYDASNISLLNAPSVSGWLSAYLNGFPESALMIWNCTDVLVASDTFNDQGDAITLYGGTNNTIWGNTFEVASVAGNPASIDDSGSWVTGINETESGDLVYDNYFAVPVPAITPTYDPFYCDQYGDCFEATYSDTWNVSEQPATAVAIVNGETLTGSIIGTAYQGGNYWSNYGTEPNPYGVLPYNDSAWITSGGDYVPLVPFSLYPVTFVETGAPTGAAWNVMADGILVASTTSTAAVESPNGTFALAVGSPLFYVASAPSTFTVNGAASTVDISFVAVANITVTVGGLSAGVAWSALLNGTGTTGSVFEQLNGVAATDGIGAVTFAVGPGTYNVSAMAPDYQADPLSISISAHSGNNSVSFRLQLPPGQLDIYVSPSNAQVEVDGTTYVLAVGTSVLLIPGVVAGIAAIEATAPGYEPYFNNVSVPAGGVVSFSISLQSTPSSGFSTLAIALVVGLAILAAAFLAGMVYYARRPPSRGPVTSSPQPWQEGSIPKPPPPPPGDT